MCVGVVVHVKPQAHGPQSPVHVPQTQKVKSPVRPTPLPDTSGASTPYNIPAIQNQGDSRTSRARVLTFLSSQPTHPPSPGPYPSPRGHLLPPKLLLTRQQGTHTVVAVLEPLSGVSSSPSSSIASLPTTITIHSRPPNWEVPLPSPPAANERLDRIPVLIHRHPWRTTFQTSSRRLLCLSTIHLFFQPFFSFSFFFLFICLVIIQREGAVGLSDISELLTRHTKTLLEPRDLGPRVGSQGEDEFVLHRNCRLPPLSTYPPV